MKNFPSSFRTSLSSDSPILAMFIDLDFISNYRLTTAPRVTRLRRPKLGNSQLTALYEYTPADFISISPPVYNSYTSRNLFSVQVVDNSGQMQWELEQGQTGKRVFVRLGILQENSDLVLGGFAYKIYQGYLDRGRVELTKDQKLVTLECSSPTGNLLSNVSYPFTKEGRKLVSENDTSFDHLEDDFSEITSNWGQERQQ